MGAAEEGALVFDPIFDIVVTAVAWAHHLAALNAGARPARDVSDRRALVKAWQHRRRGRGPSRRRPLTRGLPGLGDEPAKGRDGECKDERRKP